MSFKSSILRSDLCYYNDAYIGLKGRYKLLKEITMIKQVFNRINKNKIIRSKSFEYKTKLMGTTPNNNTLDIDVVIPLKYLSNF